MTHPLFMRKLVNRNPATTNLLYAPGRRGDGLGDAAGVSPGPRSPRAHARA